ncbi:MAG: MmgE/PrpD family protein [Burkholderiales bacterium]|nr:MmgE/PrpD family protein [Burkholderiales bacterium]
MSLTAKLAEHIGGITFDSLSPVDLMTVKRLIADGIAVAMAGSREEAPPAIFAEHAREQGGDGPCPVWGFGFRTSPFWAAYANAVSMHVLDFEPMSSPSTHAVSPAVPAALAIAVRDGHDGRELIAACAKGFEIQGRILAAAGHKREHSKLHAPGMVGPFGSAVAVAHLLKLDATQLVNALGIAASRAGSLRANIGYMVKCTHCGNAAAGGLEAALLAARGFTANADIFGAAEGYAAALFPKGMDEGILLDYGKPFRFVDPGMAIKFYPSKYPTHFGISAALEVQPAVGDPAKIASVRITTPAMPDVSRPEPGSGLEGKFSFQYTVACALLDGRVGMRSFHDGRRYREDMTALLPKIAVTMDPTIPTEFTKMRVAVEVQMRDGIIHRAVCDRPPGFWGVPFDDSLHREKIRDCLGTRLDRDRVTRVEQLLESLEGLSAERVKELGALLC